MSGETGKEESGWTVDSSREDMLARFEALEKLINRRFIDNDKAIEAALLAAKEAVAAALATAKEAVTKAEVANDKRFDAANQVKTTFGEELNRKLDRTEYESNHKALEEKIGDVTDRMNRNDGQTKGSDMTMGKVIAVVGASVAVLTLVLSVVVLAANGKFG